MGKKTSKAMKGISCALAAVIFGLGAAALATKGFGAFEREGVQTFVGNTGGTILGNGAGNGLRLMSAVIAKADYAANGVSPLAETAYTITVTPTPADAVDTYTWTSTDNESVKLTPSNGGKSCKVECLKAFGTQITLMCTSDSNADVKADVTVDYVKRISSVSMSINPASVKFGSTETAHTITATPVWGTGTITPSNFKVTGGTLKNNIMEDQFVLNGLRNASRTGLFGGVAVRSLFELSVPDVGNEQLAGADGSAAGNGVQQRVPCRGAGVGERRHADAEIRLQLRRSGERFQCDGVDRRGVRRGGAGSFLDGYFGQ